MLLKSDECFRQTEKYGFFSCSLLVSPSHPSENRKIESIFFVLVIQIFVFQISCLKWPSIDFHQFSKANRVTVEMAFVDLAN